MPISVLIKDLGWYLRVIGKLHNEECLIYILTGEVQYVTPNTFTRQQYNNWFQQFRDNFSSVLNNTTYDNIHS